MLVNENRKEEGMRWRLGMAGAFVNVNARKEDECHKQIIEGLRSHNLKRIKLVACICFFTFLQGELICCTNSKSHPIHSY